VVFNASLVMVPRAEGVKVLFEDPPMVHPSAGRSRGLIAVICVFPAFNPGPLSGDQSRGERIRRVPQEPKRAAPANSHKTLTRTMCPHPGVGSPAGSMLHQPAPNMRWLDPSTFPAGPGPPTSRTANFAAIPCLFRGSVLGPAPTKTCWVRVVAEFTTEPSRGEYALPEHTRRGWDFVQTCWLDGNLGPLGTVVAGERDRVFDTLRDVMSVALELRTDE